MNKLPQRLLVPQRFAELEAIDTLITDSGLAGEDAAALGARIRSVVVV